jgi:hypothetical protein
VATAGDTDAAKTRRQLLGKKRVAAASAAAAAAATAAFDDQCAGAEDRPVDEIDDEAARLELQLEIARAMMADVFKVHVSSGSGGGLNPIDKPEPGIDELLQAEPVELVEVDEHGFEMRVEELDDEEEEGGADKGSRLKKGKKSSAAAAAGGGAGSKDDGSGNSDDKGIPASSPRGTTTTGGTNPQSQSQESKSEKSGRAYKGAGTGLKPGPASIRTSNGVICNLKDHR